MQQSGSEIVGVEDLCPAQYDITKVIASAQLQPSFEAP